MYVGRLLRVKYVSTVFVYNDTYRFALRLFKGLLIFFNLITTLDVLPTYARTYCARSNGVRLNC